MWLTASNYKKQNDVIEIEQKNKRYVEWRVEKKQLIEIKRNKDILVIKVK